MLLNEITELACYSEMENVYREILKLPNIFNLVAMIYNSALGKTSVTVSLSRLCEKLCRFTEARPRKHGFRIQADGDQDFRTLELLPFYNQ